MKMNLVRTDSFRFVPAEDTDLEKARKVPQGAVVECNVRILRNYAFMRKFWALVRTAYSFLTERQREFFHNSEDGFRCTLEVAAGYYDEFYDVTRRAWVQKPKSIAFDKMDEAEFSQLYESVVDVIFKVFLGHVNEEEFRNALKDF